MKKVFLLLVAGLFSASIFAAKGIVVEQKYTSNTGLVSSAVMTWYITDEGCKLKMQFSDNKVATNTYFVPNTKTAELLTYGDGELPQGVKKTYFAIPIADIKPDAKMDISNMVVTKTGETKEISGFTCEKVIIKTTTTETETWVTKDFKVEFYKFAPYFRTSIELMGLSREKIKGVPLVSVTKDLKGKVVNSLDLVTATKTDIPETDLQVPSDYVSSAAK